MPLTLLLKREPSVFMQPVVLPAVFAISIKENETN